jgi:hypothetical protein
MIENNDYDSNIADKNWVNLLKSKLENTFLHCKIEEGFLNFTKNGSGPSFYTFIEENSLYKVCSKDTAYQIKQNEQMIPNSYFIGSFEQGHKTEKKNWIGILHNDRILSKKFSEIVGYFDTFIDFYSQWPSFSQFLMNLFGHNTTKALFNQQTPLGYWWLIGDLEEKYIHQNLLYNESGVFIRPNDGYVPVFTSSIFAEIACQAYKEQYSVELVPEPMKCLGCFLSGFSNEIGAEELRGAILDSQWEVIFYSCDQLHGNCQGKHFFLNDSNGESFALVGCTHESTPPLWCERRWDTNNEIFPSSHTLIPW